VALASAGLLVAPALPAQPLPGAFVRPGDRVRVTTHDGAAPGGRRIGVFEGVARDSLTVTWDAGARSTLPLDVVRRLDVSDGRGSFIGLGMGVGFLGGAVVGAIRGASEADGGGEYVGPGLTTAFWSVAGGLIGAVGGGLIGAVGRREHWSRVRLDPPLRRVSLTPMVTPQPAGPMRFGFHVGLRF
jgi:hypothetical protein